MPRPHPTPGGYVARSPRSLFRRIGVAAGTLGVLALPACSNGPSEPEGFPASPEAVAAFLPSVEDARDRILPALEDRAAAAEVGRHLGDLAASLHARRSSRARRALTQARGALDAYGRGSPVRVGDGPELSAVELVLDGAGRLLPQP